jgi:F420H(2)-dependent quinone reductase
MVLETVGRRSGRPRATPVLYLRDGERLVITPANAGAKRMPDWWLNLQAAKEATALIGERRLRVRPRVAEGDERERLWHEFAARLAALDEYSRFTEREFPIVVLERERG